MLLKNIKVLIKPYFMPQIRILSSLKTGASCMPIGLKLITEMMQKGFTDIKDI